MRNKLVVFEGIDGAGKATQVRLLASRLRKAGARVTTFSFPRYGTITGNLIKKALRGEFGDFHRIPAIYGSLPYAVDRGLARSEIDTALNKGIVISDRYAGTNIAFGGALCTKKEFKEFVNFFEVLEYECFQMPRPDLVIYLDVPIATSQKWLHMEAGKKLDRNEKDVAFQKRVASIYTKLSKQKEWVRIACTSKSTPAQIHETVWRVIRRFLK